MKKLTNLLVIVLVAIVFGAPMTTRGQAAADQGVDTVKVLNATAHVEKIDIEDLKITLLLIENGKYKTFKVAKSVQNLDQVEVGDRLKIKYTEEVLVAVGSSLHPPSAADVREVRVAPKGAMPGNVMTETYAMTAKVRAVDAAKHKVTLEDPDGKIHTIKLSKGVTNLGQLKVGDTVGTVIADSLVVEVVKGSNIR